MFTAATLILFFLAVREWFRPGRASRRSSLWLFLAAGLMFAGWCAYFAVFGFDFVYGSQADSALRVESVCAGWVLAGFAVVFAVAHGVRDGRIPRVAIACVILLTLLVFGVSILRHRSAHSSAEEARFRRNLSRCARLVEQGNRKALAEAVPAVSGENLREVNERFEAVLNREEEAGK